MRWQHAVTSRDPVTLLTLEQAKRDLDITFDDDDVMIGDYIKSAVSWVEEYTGRFLSRANIELYADSLPLPFNLPFGPFASLTSLTARGSAIAPRIVAGEAASLLPPAGLPWPSLHAEIGSVVVSYTVGYATPDEIPAELRQGAMLVVRILYDKPDGKELKDQWMGVENLLSLKRIRNI